jgi:hypothetical protein
MRIDVRDVRVDAPASIIFHIATGSDARRALDAQVDALVSDQRAVLDYARALPRYTSTPLPWSRTYALASPANAVAPPRGARRARARCDGGRRACVGSDARMRPAASIPVTSHVLDCLRTR